MDIEVRIRGLMMDPATNMPIVVLKDTASDAVMPIWVGIFEANAIAVEIEKLAAPRPMTHDLTRNLIHHLNGRLERVVITEIKDDTFFAKLWLRQGDGAGAGGCSAVGCDCAGAAVRLSDLRGGAGDAVGQANGCGGCSRGTNRRAAARAGWKV